MADRRYREEQFLRKQYCDNGQTLQEIGDMCSASTETIRNWMEKHSIPRESISEATANGNAKPLHDKSWLREEYSDKGKSTVQIGEELGVASSTVKNWLDKHSIDTRETFKEASDGDYSKLSNKDWFETKYYNEGSTYQEIAEETNVAYTTAIRWGKRHSIKSRKVGQRGDVDYEKLNSEEYLRDAYIQQGKTIEQIAEGCDTSPSCVWGRLKEFGIETNDRGIPEGRELPNLSKSLLGDSYGKLTDGEWLTQKYIEEQRSTTEIAEILDVKPSTVYRYLLKNDVTLRNRIDALPSGEDHHFWKENVPVEWGPNWNEQRLKARLRDQGRCQRCGLHDGNHKDKFGCVCHIHHIKPRSELIGPNGDVDYETANELSNLITLCLRCHMKLEGLPIDART